MGSVQIKSEIKVGVEEILAGIEQLDTPDLERFVDQVNLMLAHRKTTSLSKEETLLLSRVIESIPAEKITRQRHLLKKLQTEALTEKERKELEALTLFIENKNVDRVKDLIELARIRNVNLTDLINQLGLRMPADV